MGRKLNSISLGLGLPGLNEDRTKEAYHVRLAAHLRFGNFGARPLLVAWCNARPLRRNFCRLEGWGKICVLEKFRPPKKGTKGSSCSGRFDIFPKGGHFQWKGHAIPPISVDPNLSWVSTLWTWGFWWTFSRDEGIYITQNEGKWHPKFWQS